MKNDDSLLREYISLLTEDDMGYGGGDYMGSTSTSVVGSFINPFKDLLTVTKASGQKMLRVTKNLLGAGFESLFAIIPFYKVDYKKYTERLEQEFKEIDDENKEVLSRINRVFNSTTFKTISYLARPDLVLSYNSIKTIREASPKIKKQFWELITGGLSKEDFKAAKDVLFVGVLAAIGIKTARYYEKHSDEKALLEAKKMLRKKWEKQTARIENTIKRFLVSEVDYIKKFNTLSSIDEIEGFFQKKIKKPKDSQLSDEDFRKELNQNFDSVKATTSAALKKKVIENLDKLKGEFSDANNIVTLFDKAIEHIKNEV